MTETVHETRLLNRPHQEKPERYMHSAARKRAGLPPYISLPSLRTRRRNEAWRKYIASLPTFDSVDNGQS